MRGGGECAITLSPYTNNGCICVCMCVCVGGVFLSFFLLLLLLLLYLHRWMSTRPASEMVRRQSQWSCASRSSGQSSLNRTSRATPCTRC
jgi:hypothetical protein